MSLRIQWTTTPVTGGGPAYLNFYFDDLAAASQACATASRNFLVGIAPNMNNNTIFTLNPTALVFDPATGFGLQQLSVTGANVPGTSSTAPGPGQVQLLMSLNTGLYVGGRQIQGRLNLPAPASSTYNSGSGFLTTATQTSLNTAGAALVADSTCSYAVWSRKNGTTQPIVSAAASPLLATLRSRSVRG